MNNKTNRLALSAMLLTVMMVLGYIESLIPMGTIPGIKIGLSNSVLLLSLYWLGIAVSVLLMLMKVLLSAFMFGGFMALPYSLAGGSLSLILMIVLIYLIRGVSPVGAGIAGAVMHNAGQVLVAMFILPTIADKLLFLMGVLILTAIVTGALTGTVAKMLMNHLPKSRRKFLIQNLVRDFPVKPTKG